MSQIQSQNAEILSYLRQGRTITSLQARKMFGTIALNSRISQIRNNMKVEVKDVWVKVKTRKGETRVKKYFLDEAT